MGQLAGLAGVCGLREALGWLFGPVSVEGKVRQMKSVQKAAAVFFGGELVRGSEDEPM